MKRGTIAPLSACPCFQWIEALKHNFRVVDLERFSGRTVRACLAMLFLRFPSVQGHSCPTLALLTSYRQIVRRLMLQSSVRYGT